jgi:hypothetical protein
LAEATLIRLAVVRSTPPKAVVWCRDLPYPSVPLCWHCARYLAIALATASGRVEALTPTD